MGTTGIFFVVEPLKDLMLVPVFSLQEVEVCKCKWRGPAWLTSYLGRPLRSAEFGVVAEKVAGPMSLMTLACEEACCFSFQHIDIVVSLMVMVLLLFPNW